jgi:hypothetical protein
LGTAPWRCCRLSSLPVPCRGHPHQRAEHGADRPTSTPTTLSTGRQHHRSPRWSGDATPTAPVSHRSHHEALVSARSRSRRPSPRSSLPEPTATTASCTRSPAGVRCWGRPRSCRSPRVR